MNSKEVPYIPPVVFAYFERIFPTDVRNCKDLRDLDKLRGNAEVLDRMKLLIERQLAD